MLFRSVQAGREVAFYVVDGHHDAHEMLACLVATLANAYRTGEEPCYGLQSRRETIKRASGEPRRVPVDPVELAPRRRTSRSRGGCSHHAWGSMVAAFILSAHSVARSG